MSQNFLFPEMKLADGLVRDLRRMNPWWEGKPQQVLPPLRRHVTEAIRRRIEKPLAPIVVVRGPRQVGKTTAQLQVIGDLLESGVAPARILRAQFDELGELSTLSEPILRIVDWYEGTIARRTLNESARAGEPCFLFLDEVQNLQGWAPQLKHLVDASTVQIVVTGSSALRIEQGRDSLAGRISTIETGTLSLTEIGRFHGLDVGDPALADNGLAPLLDPSFWRELAVRGARIARARDSAFRLFSERGGYPLAHRSAEIDWSHLAEQLNETVIRRVIEHDLRIGERGRKRDPLLLEEVFRLACRYAGQAPGAALIAREAQRALHANVGPQRAQTYLRFLGDSLLLHLVEPLEIRLKKKRGHAKICLADHGLRASWLQEIIPLSPPELDRAPHMTTLAGRLAESVVGACLASIHGLQISHSPERATDPEVDFVLTIGLHRVPLEIKYHRRLDPLRDTEGLRSFVEKTANNAPFGILVVQGDDATVADPRIVVLPLSSLLLLR